MSAEHDRLLAEGPRVAPEAPTADDFGLTPGPAASPSRQGAAPAPNSSSLGLPDQLGWHTLPLAIGLVAAFVGLVTRQRVGSAVFALVVVVAVFGTLMRRRRRR